MVRMGRSTQPMVHSLDDCYTVSLEIPEAAHGFKEPLLLGWKLERGLEFIATLMGRGA
jgi:hypothetical protein